MEKKKKKIKSSKQMGEIKKEIICPMKIGPYRLKDTIGQGAYATVKLAFNVNDQKYYACKIIRKQRIQTEHQKENFVREIRILQQMRNPHIVSLFDLLTDTINYYVILEYCPNGDLLNVCVSKIKLTEDEARVYLKEILLGLKFVHQNKVGHRDLKPENIMIDAEGHAKISDFGLSKFITGKSNLTSTACGSPCYTSPEVISDAPYDPIKSDMWSVGVILYAMVTGQLPWTKRNKIQLFQQIRSADYFIPTTLSMPLQSLIKNLMNKNPDDRYTVEEALNSEFMTMVPTPEDNFQPNDIPYVSLRKVDRFFELDEEDDIPNNVPKRCCSSTNVTDSAFQKTVKFLISSNSAPSPKGKIKRIENCVSNYMKTKPNPLTIDVGQIDIQDIMKKVHSTKKSKKVRIIRPLSKNYMKKF